MYYYEFQNVGTVLYICVLLVILLLCIPYLVYFFCIKYCYPRNDSTIVTSNTNVCTADTICHNDNDNNISKQDDDDNDNNNDNNNNNIH